VKTTCIILVALLEVNIACQRSQFSTTTRHSKNGKVFYANHHPVERNKLSFGKSKKSKINEQVARNISTTVERTEMKYVPEPGTIKHNNIPVTNTSDLFASTSNDQIIYKKKINPINTDSYIEDRIDGFFKGTINNSISDTIIRKTPNSKLTFDPSSAYIIKFKSGNEDTVRIISHSHEGIYYHFVSEPKKTKFAMMDEVDTIFPDSTHSFKQAEDIPEEKATESEIKGLGYSLIGFVPVIGIPFAIIGIILGVRNLHRIGKNLASIKRKRIAQSTVIIGIAALIFNIIATIVIFSAIAAAFSSAMHRCSLGHF
jgi:hypothetical protein